MIDNRTPNRDYLLPSPLNKMKSEDVPRFIETILKIDLDVAAVIAALAGKAASSHTHEIAEIIGLVSALASKAAAIHSHNIGSLGGVSLGDAAANQLLGFNGTLWIPTSIGTVHLTNKLITNAKMRDSDPLTVIGRASASLGSPADISATANDRLLARVGDVLAFVQMTIGMVPDGLLTFAKLASSALASQAEAEAGTSAVKLVTVERMAQGIAALGGGSMKPTVFKAGGTFTKDAKTRFIRLRVQGGGGGGGGAANSNAARGGSGAAGNYVEAWYPASALGPTTAITVGANGSGAASGNNSGGAGGASSVGSLVSCPGGPGGPGAASAISNNAGAPSAPTITGSPIFSVVCNGTVSFYGSPSNSFAPDAPSSPLGAGGIYSATSGTGDAASGYGSAGAGGRGSSAGSVGGGAGSPGIVIIEEY